MAIYAGIDLHSNSNFLSLVDSKGKIIEKRKLANDVRIILHAQESYRDCLQGIAIESTFNWYGIVDALMDEGFRVHLANPAAIQKYSGLKHSDDASDAAWLAEMLRLRVLPEGYIYPKAERPIRDLLRKRGHLVRLRTSLITNLQGILSRNNGHSIPGRMIKQLKTNQVAPLCAANEDLALCGEVSKDTIDYLGRQIKKIEKQAEERIELRPTYKALLSMPGVGVILGLTIMLEAGPIGRFAKAGNFSSYCRKVPSTWISNGKRKGKGNTKNGNKYLVWALRGICRESFIVGIPCTPKRDSKGSKACSRQHGPEPGDTGTWSFINMVDLIATPIQVVVASLSPHQTTKNLINQETKKPSEEVCLWRVCKCNWWANKESNLEPAD